MTDRSTLGGSCLPRHWW